MCILFMYMDPTPKKDGYRLIICANRDEYYRRPAKYAFKCEKTGVIGGRDMELGRENGMWLGITCNKLSDCKLRFGALLNVNGEQRKNGASGRSSIVADYLSGKEFAAEYNERLQNDGATYNAFNFVAVEVRHWPDPELIRRSPVYGEQLSSIYVKFLNAGYGTRTHSLILVDANWNVQFIEETMKEPIDSINPAWNTIKLSSHL